MATRSSRSHGKTGFAPPPTSSVYRNIAISFLGLTLVVIVAALWVSSVHAKVDVKTVHETDNLDTTVDIAKSPQAGQLQGRVVEGVFSKIQEFSVKETTGTAVSTTVTGTVRIFNNYSQPQTLIKTTRLQTPDGRIYRIDKTVVIDPKQSVLVTAHSDQPGSQYVLANGTNLAIPGLWIDIQKWIYAQTVSGFQGGEQISKVVSSDDVTQAQKALQDAVFAQAQSELKAEAGAGDDWDAVYIDKTIQSDANVAAGQQSDSFLATVKLDVTAVYYPEKDMQALVMQKLTDKLPEGRELVGFDPSLVVYKVQSADPKMEKATISISAQAQSSLTNKSTELSKDAILGMSDTDAKTKLMAIDGVQSVDISITPSWIHKLPTSGDHIDLTVE
ncbi:MAG: hypothetical protein WA001_03660 [Patescibacteria group bacterium]